MEMLTDARQRPDARLLVVEGRAQHPGVAVREACATPVSTSLRAGKPGTEAVQAASAATGLT